MRVEALWDGRIYRGKLNMLDGDPGCGKTMIALDLAARVTTGRPLPGLSSDSPAAGEHASEPGGVAYFTVEDDPGDTIRPRLLAAGGDPGRFLVVTHVTPPAETAGAEPQPRLVTLNDTAEIVRAIQRVGARLVIFDPFNAYLGEINAYKDQEVRRLLAPLARIAQVTGAAFLFIRHPNKAVGSAALYRGGGSIGIIGAARSGLVAGRDPASPVGESRGALASVKNNLGAPVPSLAYQIVADAAGLPVVRWLGESQLTAEALLGHQVREGQQDDSQRARARRWLSQALTEGPRLEEELRTQAAEEGISYATLRRAKQDLGAGSVRQAFGGAWSWRLPIDAEADAETA
jgi:hypothetical protein